MKSVYIVTGSIFLQSYWVSDNVILVRFVVHLLFMEAPLTVEATVRRDHNAITIYMCESRKSRNNWQ